MMHNGQVALVQTTDKGCIYTALYKDTLPGDPMTDLKIIKLVHTRLLHAEANNRQITVNERTFLLSQIIN